MFAKKIFDSKNDLYMSWLPLKLGAVGGISETSSVRTEKHISNKSSTRRLESKMI